MSSDWSTYRLGDIAITQSGGTPSRSNNSFFNGETPWIKSGELNDSTIYASQEKISTEAIQSSSAKVFEPNTLLLAMYGATVGKTGILKIRAATNQAVCAIRPKENNFNIEFLKFYLIFIRPQLLRERYGGAQPNISQTLIQDLKIPLPLLKEQKNIAAFLFKIQQAIEIQESIIEKTRELKNSTLHYVFTHGLRGEILKETEIGPIPESWIVQKIGDIGKIVTGTTPPTIHKEYYQAGHYQFIAPNDIGKTTKIYEAEKKITDKGLEVSRLLPKESVCFVCIGSTIGKVGITAEEKTTTNQQINTIIVNSGHDPYFVTYLLDYKSEYIASFASPSPVPILSKGKFEKINIMLSSDIEEQREIACVLMTIDEKIEIHTAKKSALQDLFKTTLNKLMTGEIRVKDLDIEISEVES